MDLFLIQRTTKNHNFQNHPYTEPRRGARKGRVMNQTNTRRTDIPLTLRESVKDAFAQRGLSISEWARKHNLAPQYVYDLLNGRTNGARGESHRAAVLLGLKEGVIEERAAS